MSLKIQKVISAPNPEQALKQPVFKVPDILPRRYAKAFYTSLVEKNLLSEIIPQVFLLKESFDQNGSLRAFVANAALNHAVRDRILSKIAAESEFHSFFQNFLKLVVKRGRLALLPEILGAVLYFAAEAQGEVPVKVLTSVEMTEGQKQQLLASLKEKGYESPHIFEEIDPSLLGGAVVQIGFQLYDTSLKGRLSRLKNAFKGEV